MGAVSSILMPDEAEVGYGRALQAGKVEEYIRDRIRHRHLEEDIRHAVLRVDSTVRWWRPDRQLYRYLHDLVVGGGAAWSKSTKNGKMLHVNRLCGTIYWAGRAEDYDVFKKLGSGLLCGTCRRRLLAGGIDWRLLGHPDFDGEPHLTRTYQSRGW